MKNNFATIVTRRLSILKLFQLSNGDFIFLSMPTAFTECVNLEF